MPRPEPRSFIHDNLRLRPAPSVPEIQLYAAHSGSGLRRLSGKDNETPPYWAYPWGGGAVLARYIFDRPEVVAGQRVVDLGTGSGLVGIAAMKSGAEHVAAVDIDPLAIAAARLNAEANGVVLDLVCEDILDKQPPAADIILVGDLFYEEGLANRVLVFLQCCRGAGLDVLIGDPKRRDLPLDRLICVAEYPVADFGDAPDGMQRMSGVYVLS